MNLGQRLKYTRLKEGLSLRALEPIVGVSFSALARIERGVGTYTRDTIERVTRWVETGSGTEKKRRHGRSWILTIEQRLARIERAIGLAEDSEKAE